MKLFWLIIFIFIVFSGQCFASNFVEIDLNKKEIRLDNFRFGKYDIIASLLFDITAKDNSLILSLEGNNIRLKRHGFCDYDWLEHRNLSWIKLRILLKDNSLFINYFHCPEFLVKGKVDLATQDFLFDVNGAWKEKSIFVEGDIKLSLKVWGKPIDYLMNGVFDVKNGIYQDIEFSDFNVHFLGKPPLFYLNDSQVTLPDGGIYRINGVMDTRDFRNIFPKADFVSRKVTLAGWQLLSESERKVGLKKNVDNDFDVVLGADSSGNEDMKTGTEVRYNVKKSQFLKLRMQDDKTIVGFERRKEF
jgi:hypothetical protein